MTPEQIEVGVYYVVVPEGCQFKVTRTSGIFAYGISVYDDAIQLDDRWNVVSLLPSTCEAFNAAVDRVAQRVKGET